MFSACEIEWDILSGVGTLDGEYQDTVSQVECLSLCISDPYCVAADISSGIPVLCFLHRNDSLIANSNYTNPSISQHRIINRCPSGTSRLFVPVTRIQGHKHTNFVWFEQEAVQTNI